MHVETEMSRPIGHPTLRLDDIAPEKSPSYSPNLYRWMHRRAHFYRGGGVADGVYRVKSGSGASEHFGAGALLIGYPTNGYPGDNFFSGSRLMAVLCQGSRENRWAYPGIATDLEWLDDFWDRYLVVGRCAIDPGHEEHFACTNRYSTSGDERACLWCGHRQHRAVTERVVFAETWVSD